MENKTMAWLIGAKIVCCGALLLVLAGELSFAGIGAFLTGNALPLAGGGAVLTLVLAGLPVWCWRLARRGWGHCCRWSDWALGWFWLASDLPPCSVRVGAASQRAKPVAPSATATAA